MEHILHIGLIIVVINDGIFIKWDAVVGMSSNLQYFMCYFSWCYDCDLSAFYGSITEEFTLWL